MENLLEFEGFQPNTPVATQTPAGDNPDLVGKEPPFGKIDFSMSGVSDDGMKIIAGLMAQRVLYSGEAERVARMADTDPVAAAAYLQKKIEGMIHHIPGVNPAFIQSMKSQAVNIGKYMVEILPEVLGHLTDRQTDSSELRPDASKTSFLTKLSSFFDKQI